ncbi:hypothetical protein [Actinacidiphila yeochonensis]|uniref:hypothetical protein n=1 Tax=Actinacidiphila yeochonensis TaxID=89050 RepID=UPI001E4B83ED
MRTEEVLAAVGCGVWQWDESAGTVAVDGRAARLLGLSGGAATHRYAAVRARLHPADYVALSGAVSLATAEGTVAEASLRVVGDAGTVERTVQVRLRPRGSLLSGTLHELREPARLGGYEDEDGAAGGSGPVDASSGSAREAPAAYERPGTPAAPDPHTAPGTTGNRAGGGPAAGSAPTRPPPTPATTGTTCSRPPPDGAPPGRPASGRCRTGTGAGPARRSCWTPAGRWPRPTPPPRCCGWRPTSPCPASPPTAWPSSASTATTSP